MPQLRGVLETRDLKNLRSKFPFFSNTSYAYLDSAATSQKPKSVIDTMRDFYERENASVHRGIYLLSEEATDRFEKVREKVAKWLNAKSYDIIFTSGTTGAINLVADSVKNSCNKSDKILLTRCEHHANFLPWQRIAKLAFLPFDKEKILVSPDASFDGIRLAAVTGFSNVLGDVWDGKLSEFVSNARAAGVQVLIDGAQLVAHEQVDLEALQPDFFAFSGHKILGPTGVGVLCIKKEIAEKMEPYQVGGAMVHSVGLESSKWKLSPQKFEAGTPPIVQVLGLGAAIDFFESEVNFGEVHKHVDGLSNKLRQHLIDLPGVTLLSLRGSIVSFSIHGIHAHDVAAFLGDAGVFVRAGHHCAQPLHAELGIESSVRASFFLYNNEGDVERAIGAIDRCIAFFNGGV